MSQKALSLVCNECGLQLKSAKAVTVHATETGHSDFAESTEAVREIVCLSCGKVCQTQVEVDQHKRVTSHADFEDRTGLDNAVVQSGVSGSGGEIDLSSATSKPNVVNSTLLKQITEMGFSEARAMHALIGGCTAVESAVTWLTDRIDDASLDIAPENVTIDDTPPKAPLTEEEKAMKVEELKHKLEEKRIQREAEEAEAARERERRRIAEGKAMAETREAMEEKRRRDQLEQVKREKEADRIARDKIRTKVLADKYTKQGMDPGLALKEAEAEIKRQHEEAQRQIAERRKAEAEEAAQRQKQQEGSSNSGGSGGEWVLTTADGGNSSTAATAPTSSSLPFIPLAQNVAAASIYVAAAANAAPTAEQIKGAAEAIPADQRDGVSRILSNVITHPLDSKFRTLKMSNAALSQAVPTVDCARLLLLCGFRPSGENLTMNTVVMRRLATAIDTLGV
eukprot:PhM_4_TR5707/c0_g1_i1/m.94729